MAHQQNQQTTTEPVTTTWDLDPAHSSLEFSIKHMMFANVRGRFRTFTTTIFTDETDPADSRVVADVDVASIDTGVADRDAHLRSGDFFDADAHPKMTFRSTRVVPKEHDRAEVIGDLTIRGVTNEVVLDVVRDGVGQDPWGNTRASYTASGTIDRDAFGLKWNQLLETGGVLVGNKVKIEVQVQVVQRAD